MSDGIKYNKNIILNENRNNMKSGVEKNDFDEVANPKLQKKYKSLFDMIDKNQNGTIETTELEAFEEQIINAARSDKKEDKLSNKEARKLIKELRKNIGNAEKINVKTFIKFLEQYENISEDIDETVDEDGNTVVKREGKTIITDKDGNRTEISNNNGVEKKISYDKDNKPKTKSVKISENGKTVVKKYTYQDRAEILQQEIISDEIKEEIYSYESDTKKLNTVSYKKDNGNFKEGDFVRYENENNYTINRKNGDKIIQEGDKTTTEYQNGTIVVEDKDFIITTATIANGSGKTKTTVDKNTQTTTVETLDNNNKVYKTTVTDKDKNTIEYNVDGNITNVVVQDLETIDQICQKYNIDKNAFTEANKDKIKNGKIEAGTSVVIPAKNKEGNDIQPAQFANVQKNRMKRDDVIKTRDERVQREQQAAEARRRAAIQKAEQERALAQQVEAENKAKCDKLKKENQNYANYKAQGAAVAADYHEYRKAHRNITLSKEAMTRRLNKLDKDNVAYFVLEYNRISGKDASDSIESFDKLGGGMDKTDVYNLLLKPLIEKADELGIKATDLKGSGNSDGFAYKSITANSPYSAIKKAVNLLANAIVKKEKEMVQKNTTEINELNKSLNKEEKYTVPAGSTQRTSEQYAEYYAKQISSIIDYNVGIVSLRKIKKLFDEGKINEKNIVEVLIAYDKTEVKKGDASLVDSIMSEVSALATDILKKIYELLVNRAKTAKISQNSLNAYDKKLKDCHWGDKEIINGVFMALIGDIENAQKGNNVNDKEGIEAFSQSGYVEDASNIQEDFNSRSDNWAGKFGDWLLGKYGFKTIDQMKEVVGDNYKNLVTLMNVAKEIEKAPTQSKINTFKELYLKIFGVEFNPSLMQTRQQAVEELNTIAALDITIKELERQIEFKEYGSLRHYLIKSTTDEELIEKFKNLSNEEIKERIQTIISELQEQRRQMLKAGSIEQREADIKRYDAAIFGGRYLADEVTYFNIRQQYTQMGTELCADMLLSILVPEASEILIAKYAEKGIKIAATISRINKASKAFRTFSRATTTAATVTGTHLSYGEALPQALKHGAEWGIFVGTGALGVAGRDAIIAKAAKGANVEISLMRKFAAEFVEQGANFATAMGVTWADNGDPFSTEMGVNLFIMFVLTKLGRLKGKGEPNVDGKVENKITSEKTRPSQDKPKYEIPKNETAFEKATRNGNDPTKIAPERSVGTLSKDTFGEVKGNLSDELNRITSADDSKFEELQQRINALKDRAQRRELQNMLDARKNELKTGTNHSDIDNHLVQDNPPARKEPPTMEEKNPPVQKEPPAKEKSQAQEDTPPVREESHVQEEPSTVDASSSADRTTVKRNDNGTFTHETYQNNQLTSAVVKDAKGKIISETKYTYKDGIKVSEKVTHYSKGKINEIEEIFYSDGEVWGRKFYDADGTITKEILGNPDYHSVTIIHYENGQPIFKQMIFDNKESNWFDMNGKEIPEPHKKLNGNYTAEPSAIESWRIKRQKAKAERANNNNSNVDKSTSTDNNILLSETPETYDANYMQQWAEENGLDVQTVYKDGNINTEFYDKETHMLVRIISAHKDTLKVHYDTIYRYENGKPVDRVTKTDGKTSYHKVDSKGEYTGSPAEIGEDGLWHDAMTKKVLSKDPITGKKQSPKNENQQPEPAKNTQTGNTPKKAAEISKLNTLEDFEQFFDENHITYKFYKNPENNKLIIQISDDTNISSKNRFDYYIFENGQIVEKRIQVTETEMGDIEWQKHDGKSQTLNFGFNPKPLIEKIQAHFAAKSLRDVPVVSSQPYWAKNPLAVSSNQALNIDTAYIIPSNSVLKLASYELDLTSPEIKARLDNLKDGESILVGRTVNPTTDIQINNKYVSGTHLEIVKHGKFFIIRDLGSTNGTTFVGVINTRTIQMQKGQYIEIQGTEKLNLANTIEIDLNDARIKAQINNLPEGGKLTIGRAGNIPIYDPDNNVSRIHVIIEKHNGKLFIMDNSTNGTSIIRSMNGVDIDVNRPYNRPPVSSINALQQSKKFNATHNIGTNEVILNGYKDGGRSAVIYDDGSVTSSREVIVVDRTRDTKLQEIISDVKHKTRNMTDKQKAAFLQKYICKLAGGTNPNEANIKAWKNKNISIEVLLGDIITQKPPVAVCRHRSLLFKILGDEIGLNVELQRGTFYDAWDGGAHAWNVVRFNDGTSAIYDAMHNKTSNITSGQVDEHAKHYFSLSKEPLY